MDTRTRPTTYDRGVADIVVVDDEPQVLLAVQRTLQDDGHSVRAVTGGEDAVDAVALGAPDLVVLDLRLADIDGEEVVRRLRRFTRIPILVLSGVADETRKVAALDCGADDFLEKPFGVPELLARVRALHRRTAETTEAASSTRTYGDLEVDLAHSTVHRAGVELRLTRTEWHLLRALVAQPGKLLTHQWLIREVWDDRFGEEYRQTLRTHVRSLRAKLGDDANAPSYLRTESGVGYRWIAEVSDETAERDHPVHTPEHSRALDESLHDLKNAMTALTFALHHARARLAADEATDRTALAHLETCRSASATAVELVRAVEGRLRGREQG